LTSYWQLFAWQSPESGTFSHALIPAGFTNISEEQFFGLTLHQFFSAFIGRFLVKLAKALQLINMIKVMARKLMGGCKGMHLPLDSPR